MSSASRVNRNRLGVGRRRAWWPVLAIAGTVIALLALLFGVVVLELNDTGPVLPALRLPDSLAYAVHADAATVLERLDASPTTVAIQWIKATSHAKPYARTSAEVARAAAGLRQARTRAGDDADFDTNLCAIVRHGSPPMQGAVEQSGIQCSASVDWRMQVPDGTPITYDSRPPIGGPYYPQPYPSYRIVTHPIADGTWIHNLNDGAIVLLYSCPRDCPDVVARIAALYARLPPDHDPVQESPRLLALPYPDLNHPIAVVAWDHLLELDTVDQGRIVDFYNRYIDRGPACVNLRCPP